MKTSIERTIDNEFMKRLAIGNDNQVETIIKMLQTSTSIGDRGYSSNFASLISAYAYEESRYYHDNSLIAYMQQLITGLLSIQTPDGTLDSGNLQSPPDTSFVLESLCKGAHLLLLEESKDLDKLKQDVKTFITKATDTIAVGGIHTPNHRWVVSSVLASVNALYPNQKYVDRANDWLGEGIRQDNDGEYAERSKNYASVNNRAFIEIARKLNKPELYEYVRKNLRLLYYEMDPNGELITFNSRRQDQFSIHTIMGSYMFYRYMAIYDNDAEFAAIARLIEGMEGFYTSSINRLLPSFLEEPLYQQTLPTPATLSVNYEKVFSDNALLRIRRGDMTATLFGGTDRPFLIASGVNHIPNLFAYRKGEAILRYMRFSTSFFSMGYFRSEGLKVEGDKYVLYQKLEAPYYHPLPAQYRNAQGDYKHSPSIDDRFWSKMDFEHRPTTMKTLETTITMQESNGQVELTFNVVGVEEVSVIIELVFDEGGKLTGVVPDASGENYFLESGNGRYQLGNDFIQFGPGTCANKNVMRLEGEKYSTHSGNLRSEGEHVYLTGLTPFTHKLLFS